MDVSNIDSRHKPQLADPNNTKEFNYGLGNNLYDIISAFPEVDSGHKRFEQFLTHLELDIIRSLSSLPLKTRCKNWQNKLFLQIHCFVSNKRFIGTI
jgi:hypothetical protein